MIAVAVAVVTKKMNDTHIKSLRMTDVTVAPVRIPLSLFSRERESVRERESTSSVYIYRVY